MATTTSWRSEPGRPGVHGGPAAADPLLSDPAGEVTAAWQLAQLVHGLYAAHDLAGARRTLELLYAYADASRVPQARRFARTVPRWEPEVLAYFTTGGPATDPPRPST